MRLFQTLDLSSRSPLDRHWQRLLVPGMLSCLAVGLAVVRLLFSGRSVLFWLNWNLILAWIPLILALATERFAEPGTAGSTAKFGPKALVCAVGWLLFFPNAPYLVTDFVHLRPRPPVPVQFDILLLMTFAWTGLLLGFLSLRVMQNLVSCLWSRKTGCAFAVIALMLCSFGVYIGRDGRWNSWDIIVHPFALTSWCISQFAPDLVAGTLGFCAPLCFFLLAAYLTFPVASAKTGGGVTHEE